MITSSTVLILGAGASIPYGYPSGASLRDQVLRNRSDNGLGRRLIDAGASPGEIDDFVEALRLADTYSVDAFLEHRPSFLKIGKLAIASALIPYESHRKEGLKGDWYQYLFSKLAASVDDFPRNQLTVVTFNYDRSLEAYLETALENRFGLPAEMARELRSTVPIIHVHGVLGALDPGAPGYVPYGAESSPAFINSAANTIQIVHEAGDDSEAIQQAKEALANASTVCFLGFGFHPVNVMRLSYTIARQGATQYLFATTLGLGVYEIEMARRLVAKSFTSSTRSIGSENIHFGSANRNYPESSVKCLDYLRDAPVLRVSI